jgi:amino acid transporter
MMGGFSLLCAYGLFGASLIGGFATFTANDLKNYLSIDIPWIWLALLAVLIVVAIGYFDVEISAKVLGVALVTEVIIIMIFSLAVLFKGGNGGLDVSNLNPIASLNHGVAPGIGVFFAFWSWVGFEAAPNYAEESKDPVRTIPIAVYFSCVGVGVLYTFMSWMVVTAYGKGEAATNAFNAGTGTTPASVTVHGHTFISNTDTFVTGVFEAYAPKVFADIMNWLIVSGSVACAAALTNAGLRYWYAMGREGILPRALGKTHPRHKSPHVAIFTQGGISAVLCILFWFANAKAYDMYLDLAAQGVIWIVLVQAFTALSTFFYFRREHPTEQHWWKTIAAPWLGFIGQIYVLLLMYHNFYFLAAGNWYSNPSFTVPFPSIPTLGELQFNPIAVIGVVVPLAALLYAVMLRTTNPAKYEVLGRFVNEGAA